MLLDFFTPIGRDHKPRRNNAAPARARLYNPSPLTIALGIGVSAAVVGAGVAWWRQRERAAGQLPPPRLDPTDPNNALASFVKLGATLGESQYVVDDVAQPIYLASPTPGGNTAEDYSTTRFAVVSELSVWVNNGPMEFTEVIFGVDQNNIEQLKQDTWTAWDDNDKQVYGQNSPKAIALLVTNVTGDFARFAYEYVLSQIGQDEAVWETPEARDETIKKILLQLAPQIDWSQGLAPYTYGDAAYFAWTAVELLGQVGYQTLVNKS